MPSNQNDNHEPTRESSIQKLMCELEKGRCSGEQDGWLNLDDVERALLKNTLVDVK